MWRQIGDRGHFFVIFAGTLTLALLLSATMPMAQTKAAGPVQKVRFMRPLPPDISMAWYFVPLDKGYFRDLGIEPELIQGAVGTGSALAQLIAGSVDIAQSGADPVVNAVGQGEHLVSFWQAIGGSIFGIQARGDRGISRPRDLKGKTIGVLGMASATRYAALEVLGRAGLKESDVNLVVLGGGGASYGPALARGQVDALGTWDTPKWTVETTAGDESFRKHLVYFSAENYLSDVFVTTQKYYDANKPALAAFAAALVRGYTDIARDPAEAVRITTKYVPAAASGDPALNRRIVEIRERSMSRTGRFEYERYAKALKFYREVGLIKAVPTATQIQAIFRNEVPDLVKQKLGGR